MIVKNKILVWSFVVFILAFSVRVFWISQKSGLHVDEGLNHIIYSINRVLVIENYPQNVPLSGKALKSVTYRNDSDIKKLIINLKILRDFNGADIGHLSLYSTIYRLWIVGASDPLELKEFIMRGCSLNLLFFCFSFVFMFLLLKRLFGDNMLVPFGLCVSFLNTGALSNTLFIRPYALQEMIFILVTLVFVVYYKKIRENENLFSLKNFFIIAVSGALGLLSGYFVLLYIGILAFILLLLNLKPFRYKNILFLIFGFVLAFILAVSFYKGYFLGFESSRAKDVLETINNNNFILPKLFSASVALFTNLLSFTFYLPLCILLALAGIKKYQKSEIDNSKLPLLLFFISVVWAFAVLYAAPFRILRYFMAAIPIISLLVPYLFQKLRVKPFIVLGSLYVFILGVSCSFPLNVESYDSEQISYPPALSFTAHIENIQNQRKYQCNFRQKPDTPVLVFNNQKLKWYYANVVIHFPDNQVFELSNNIRTDMLKKYNHFYTLYDPSMQKNMIIPENIEVVDKFQCGHFSGYELERRH